MKNIFLFSDSFRQFGKYLKFQLSKFRGWIFILFKRNRKLSEISFDYYKNWQFEQTLLVIDFKFKNAIWYKIGNYKSVDFKKPIRLNLQNLKFDIVKFEVYGFFQKHVLYIQLNKELKIENKSFQTNISNISDLTVIPSYITIQIPSEILAQIPNKILVQIKTPIINLGTSKLKLGRISVENNKIDLLHSKFKTQDYI